MANGEQKILGLNANLYVNVGAYCKQKKCKNWHVIITCWWPVKGPEMKRFLKYNGKWRTKNKFGVKSKRGCINNGF